MLGFIAKRLYGERTTGSCFIAPRLLELRISVELRISARYLIRTSPSYLSIPTQTKPVVLTTKTFDAAIADHRVALVDLWATWCGPGNSMALDLDQVASESEDDVLIAKVDVDKERQLVERFGIQSMPPIITFHEGEIHSTYVGAVPAAGLRAALDQAQKPKRKACCAPSSAASKDPCNARDERPSRGATRAGYRNTHRSYQTAVADPGSVCRDR